MNGEHKIVAVWRYDKRTYNGVPVVYYGMRFCEPLDDPALMEMIGYVKGVLDALGIRWGAMHSEVKLEERGPVLVEVNCRLHGGEGIWLPVSQACVGYTQVSAMADAYFDARSFESLPTRPQSVRAHG